MTPTKAREMALLCFADHRNALWSLADQVEALTKERDMASLAAAGEIMEAAIVSRCEIDRLQYEVDAIPAIKAERDFLALANKDLSEAMARYQQLQDAAKLALDALSNHGFPYLGHTAEYEQAEAALRQAGVQ